MKKAPSKSKNALSLLIARLGNYSPQNLVSLFKADSKLSEEFLVVAACSILSQFDPLDRRPNSELLDSLLNFLQNAHGPEATLALRSIAEKHQIGRVKYEAVRRLGKVAVDADSRRLLHEYARNGCQVSANFVSESFSPEHIQCAAIEAMGDVPSPTVRDGQCLLDVIAQGLTEQALSSVFSKTVASLAVICLPEHLDQLVAMAQKCRDMKYLFMLLETCSGLNKKTLSKHQAILTDLLVRSLNAFDGRMPIDKLKQLTEKITGQELVRRMGEAFAGDVLEHDRGAICAAALEAYKVLDETRTKAFLAFARTSGNLHSNSRCIVGLTECAKAGHGALIVDHIVRHNAVGYPAYFKSRLLRDVVGSVAQTVKLVCDTLDAVELPQRQNLARNWSEGVVRWSLPDNIFQFQSLPDLREGHHYQQNDEVLSELVEALRKAQPQDNALIFLCQRLVSEQPSEGAKALAQCFLHPTDELAYLFLEALFPALGSIPIPVPLPDSPRPVLQEVEALLLPQNERWLRDHLTKYLFDNKKLNRYVLDWMRRKDLGLSTALWDPLIQQGIGGEDMEFVLDTFACSGKRDCQRKVIEAINYDSPHAKDNERLRTKSITLACDLLTKNEGLPPELQAIALENMQQRFQDPLSSRLAAYEGCRRLADARSIKALKERLKTDREPKCKSVIKAALEAIRERLRTTIPSHQDAQGLIAWLNHVGELGDAMLFDPVANMLAAAHSNTDVRVAILHCLEKLQDKRAIPLIDGFIQDVSPDGEVLRAAKHAKGILQGRGDMGMFEALSEYIDKDSPLLDLEAVNYQQVFGSRVNRLAGGLIEAKRQYHDGHWDDFIAHLDGVCDALHRHLFEVKAVDMGMDAEKGRTLAGRQDYGSRLENQGFKTTFGQLYWRMEGIHQLRQRAKTAHLEERDGTPKPGLEASDAEEGLRLFKELFENYMKELSSSRNKSGS